MEPSKKRASVSRKPKTGDKPDYVGHRERLRKRFRKAGAEGLHDYELLELLLTYGLPRKDAKPLAKDLIGRFNSLAGVLDASFKELEGVSGLGSSTATLVRLVKEVGVVYLAEGMKHRDLLRSPQAVVDFGR